MTEETESAEIVKTIVLLAKNLHLDIVAEGIETLEQHRALCELGSDFGQGYRYGRAVPSAQFEAMLTAAASSRRAA